MFVSVYLRAMLMCIRTGFACEHEYMCITLCVCTGVSNHLHSVYIFNMITWLLEYKGTAHMCEGYAELQSGSCEVINQCVYRWV